MRFTMSTNKIFFLLVQLIFTWELILFHQTFPSEFVSLGLLAYVAGVRGGGMEGGKERGKTSEYPSSIHFDFPPSLFTACHAGYGSSGFNLCLWKTWKRPVISIIYFNQPVAKPVAKRPQLKAINWLLTLLLRRGMLYLII